MHLHYTPFMKHFAKHFFLFVILVLASHFDANHIPIIHANIENLTLFLPEETDSLRFKTFGPEFLIFAVRLYKTVNSGHTHNHWGFFFFPRHFEIGQVRVHSGGQTHFRIEHKQTIGINESEVSQSLAKGSQGLEQAGRADGCFG